MPLQLTKPRMDGPHAISMFKMVTDEGYKELNPMHIIVMINQTVMALEMEKSGLFEQYKQQMIEEERVIEQQMRKVREMAKQTGTPLQ